jgi:creatine kinase
MTRLSKLRTVAQSASKALDLNPLMVGAGVATAGLVVYAMAPSSYPPNGLSPVVKGCPAWIKTGCGNDEYIFDGTRPDGGRVCATFPADKCPDKCPDLSKHSNVMADVLRKNPAIYDKLKDKKTSMGVTLAKCMKTGVDNPGHPMITTVGLVAGDEESYTVFKDLFDPVIDIRHKGHPPHAKHYTDLDWNKLSKTRIDPTCDADGQCKYTLTSRVRTGRSVRGMRLPPSCTFEERRELERVIVKGLMNLKGELKGDYFPLHGSKSYSPKPSGMTEAQENHLRSKGNLFQEPDSTLLLSSGCGRHWPDARGVFHNDAENFFVWVNEEDHMRIISMQKGDGIKQIFQRFATACNECQKVLEAEGYGFMHNDHLGYILTCPSNLGTGLRAGAMVKLPLLSSREDFRDICSGMGLQARGTAGVDSASKGGTWDISNADRLGKSEVQLVNVFIEGVAQYIKWEQMLEKGQSVDHLLPKRK